MRSDPWRAFLARILPWFDQEEYDRERKATQVALGDSRSLKDPDRIRRAYGAYDARIRR